MGRGQCEVWLIIETPTKMDENVIPARNDIMQTGIMTNVSVSLNSLCITSSCIIHCVLRIGSEHFSIIPVWTHSQPSLALVVETVLLSSYY